MDRKDENLLGSNEQQKTSSSSEQELLYEHEKHVPSGNSESIVDSDFSVFQERAQTYTPHYGGFWMRLWAYLFDALVIAAVNGILVYPVFRMAGWASNDGWFSVLGIVTGITYFTYFVLMTKFFGQTLGKMVFGLKVISLKDKSLGWMQVLFRELIGRYIHGALVIFAIPLLYILYIVVAFTPRKQGIHDLFADTTVVHERTAVTKSASF
ncbi:RDD family protein [Jeotgalibacillus soli]|uniref:Membrane protein n=1 Tax=Jeotgalibacillus soli TaxID=889306 RepID=A0A0C2V492_9BACL|nr:RDD family protein [Jeotgalibacillus soli]KIL43852.1 membrane protein [Jeotgalibacillus soli]